MDAMLPRMSVRSRCSSWSVSTTVSGMVSRHCLVHSFVPHAKTSVQFVFTSVRCRRSASYRSVVKDYQFFFLRSSVRSTPTQRVLYRFNAQHFLCVQLCVDVVCRCVCVCLRFVLYAGHANRARIIDVHVFCAPFETNTDS